MLFGSWGGAPNTHTTAHHGPEKVFRHTRDGVVCNGRCQKILFELWGGAPNTHTSANHELEKVFLDTWDGDV